ncbi:MAG: ABC transporter substrate-binding protein, partial [Chloroflexi bacterium]|nr:ABC transporter substrate-binding protein [Chloroflexota bacterium]
MPPAQLTRRTLISRLAIALSGGALASLIGACSSPSSPSLSAPTAAATTKPAAAAPTSAPAATGATSAPAAAAPTTASAPATSGARGAGGNLKVLMWQGPTILNPHLTQGTKDNIAARFCCEPLMTVSGDGTFTPVLVTEVPSRDNGGLGADGKTVTYKLKPGVKWGDGQPFTADDVVFTFDYVINKETAATTYGTYVDLEKVEAVDPMTVRLTFKQPTGGWYVPFVGGPGMVLPKHLLDKYVGTASRDAPFNQKALGTGPYMVQD